MSDSTPESVTGHKRRDDSVSSTFNRRSFLRTSIVAGTTVGLAGCTNLDGGGEGGSLRAGALMPFTGGGVTILSEQLVEGIEAAMAERDGTVLGREIELIEADTEFDPSTGKNVVDRLATRDEVDLFFGPVSSGVGEAIVPNIKEHEILTNYVNAASRNAVGSNCTKYIFKISPTNEQQVIHIAEWTANNMDGDVAILIADYTAGQQLSEFYTQYHEEAGGNVVDTIFAPLDTEDFSSYFAQVRDSGADIMWSFFTGASAIQMVRQAADFGLEEHVARTGLGYLCTQVEIPEQGDAANGWITGLEYAETLERDPYTEFTELMEQEHDVSSPTLYNCRGYAGAKSFFDAMEAAGTTDVDEVIAELEDYSFAAPHGDITYRAGDHQAVLDYYVREVRDQTNEVIDTREGVIQPDTCEEF